MYFVYFSRIQFIRFNLHRVYYYTGTILKSVRMAWIKCIFLLLNFNGVLISLSLLLLFKIVIILIMKSKKRTVILSHSFEAETNSECFIVAEHHISWMCMHWIVKQYLMVFWWSPSDGVIKTVTTPKSTYI